MAKSNKRKHQPLTVGFDDIKGLSILNDSMILN